jgi:DNA-binding response OmpR family regulator
VVAKARILLVDDEPDIVETVQYVLESDDYEVITATNGVEALGTARIEQPDLVLLDVMLPKENGYRVAKLIREDEEAGLYSRPVRIILLTARDLSHDAERERMFMEFSQADVMMYKPFDLDELLQQIATLLETGAPDATLGVVQAS